jgi:hypothetical protein
MARRFINDRLVTIKRFAPGQHESPPGEKAAGPVTPEPEAPPPVTSDVATGVPSAPPPAETSIAVPAAPAAAAPMSTPTAAPPPATPPPPPAAVAPVPAPADLQHVLRREDEELRSGLREKELEEFRRRQREVGEQLTRAIQTLEHEQSLTQARLELLQRLEGELAGLEADAAKPLAGDQFRAARRAVDQAYLELLKLERDELEETPAHDHARFEIASLTFAQLTRIGLGLTWPLILALLLAAAIVAVALLSVFGRG